MSFTHTHKPLADKDYDKYAEILLTFFILGLFGSVCFHITKVSCHHNTHLVVSTGLGSKLPSASTVAFFSVAE